ncbi:response regulator, partial [Streptomyces albidoflavus]
MSLKVVVAEDSALMREGLVGVLTRFGHQVCAAVGDADALLAAAGEHRPDLVLTDIRMPPGQGGDRGRRPRPRPPPPPAPPRPG